MRCFLAVCVGTEEREAVSRPPPDGPDTWPFPPASPLPGPGGWPPGLDAPDVCRDPSPPRVSGGWLWKLREAGAALPEHVCWRQAAWVSGGAPGALRTRRGPWRRGRRASGRGGCVPSGTRPWGRGRHLSGWEQWESHRSLGAQSPAFQPTRISPGKLGEASRLVQLATGWGLELAPYPPPHPGHSAALHATSAASPHATGTALFCAPRTEHGSCHIGNLTT